MRFKRLFSTIDTHINGKPIRTVIGGLPYIQGKAISEKIIYLKENQDWVRKVLMFEPRGSAVQLGAILTEPCTPGADVGVIYMDVNGYLDMCENTTIGVATTLIETGAIEAVEPYTYIQLDTPADVINVKVKVEENVAKEVSILEKTKGVELKSATPKISGSAYVTGIHTYVIDPDDPLQEGM